MIKIDSLRLIIDSSIVKEANLSKKITVLNKREILDISKKEMNVVTLSDNRFTYRIYIYEHDFNLKNIGYQKKYIVLLSSKIKGNNYLKGLGINDIYNSLLLIQEKGIIVFKDDSFDNLTKNIVVKDIDICFDVIVHSKNIEPYLKYLYNSENKIKNTKLGFGKTLNLKKDIDILQLNRRSNQSLKQPYLKLYNKTKELIYSDDSNFFKEYFKNYIDFINENSTVKINKRDFDIVYNNEHFLNILRIELNLKTLKIIDEKAEETIESLYFFLENKKIYDYFNSVYRYYFNLDLPKNNDDVENITVKSNIEIRKPEEKLKLEDNFLLMLLEYMQNYAYTYGNLTFNYDLIFKDLISPKNFVNATERFRLRKKIDKILNVYYLRIFEKDDEKN